MDRKKFLLKGAMGAAGIIAAPLIGFSKTNSESIDPLPADKVKEFVTAGHTDFEKTKQMLAEMPGLLYATWDWAAVILKLHWKAPATWAIKKLQII